VADRAGAASWLGVIHYHGLPMWPQAEMPRAFAGKHGMVSFEHPEQIEIAAEVCQSIVLDNGAFSAWKRKKKHDFTGYAAWCIHWLKHPAVEWCVIPDVIDGTEDQNDSLLHKWVLQPHQSVPVYHMHESLERLDRLAFNYPRIALGSSGQWADPGAPAWWARMAEMMAVLCDDAGMPRCKLHGLRMLDPLIFAQLPLASADSCNVARNVGIDSKWVGPYVPTSKAMRALVMMDRIEHHASARRWVREGAGTQNNLELLG
jgi:hypothetical protein